MLFIDPISFQKVVGGLMNISSMQFHNYEIQPGPLNITFVSDMPITFFISEFTT